MSRQDLETFRGLVVSDERVQERLRDAEPAAFATKVATVAAECSLEVTREDVEEALRERRGAWRRAWV